jgi:hypothetical protein
MSVTSAPGSAARTAVTIARLSGVSLALPTSPIDAFIVCTSSVQRRAN